MLTLGCHDESLISRFHGGIVPSLDRQHAAGRRVTQAVISF
jgi:hypothetical protein